MATKGLAWFLLLLTLGLILWGGVVHSSGSSLACPDWPLCYGEVLPEMKGGVAIEHGHRLWAAMVGLLTIFLVIATGRRRRQDRRTWQLAWLALGLVIVQGILGGITVLYRLPTLVSTAHLATSMLFLATVLWVALRLSWPAVAMPSNPVPPWLKPWVRLSLGLLYFQIVFGGFIRHSGAASACPDLPFCFGTRWFDHLSLPSQVHMVHRYLGVLVVIFLLTTVFLLRKLPGLDSRFGFLGVNATLLIFLQLGLGAVSVWSGLALPAVTAHLTGAALLLMTMVTLHYVTRIPKTL